MEKKWSQRWNMETKPWQIPYPIKNWKVRYMVVWIQNHDKFIVLIWKTLDMRFGCKIRINSLHSVQLSEYGKYRVNKIHIRLQLSEYGKYRVNKIHIRLGCSASPDMNFIDPIFFRIRTIVHCVTNRIWCQNWVVFLVIFQLMVCV